eukprot:Hpha_TRINITY_DN15778_c1_g5::TRINITY_DN15778_c1_g5_i1::g.40644::m.40644
MGDKRGRRSQSRIGSERDRVVPRDVSPQLRTRVRHASPPPDSRFSTRSAFPPRGSRLRHSVSGLRVRTPLDARHPSNPGQYPPPDVRRVSLTRRRGASEAFQASPQRQEQVQEGEAKSPESVNMTFSAEGPGTTFTAPAIMIDFEEPLSPNPTEEFDRNENSNSDASSAVVLQQSYKRVLQRMSVCVAESLGHSEQLAPTKHPELAAAIGTSYERMKDVMHDMARLKRQAARLSEARSVPMMFTPTPLSPSSSNMLIAPHPSRRGSASGRMNTDAVPSPLPSPRAAQLFADSSSSRRQDTKPGPIPNLEFTVPTRSLQPPVPQEKLVPHLAPAPEKRPRSGWVDAEPHPAGKGLKSKVDDQGPFGESGPSQSSVGTGGMSAGSGGGPGQKVSVLAKRSPVLEKRSSFIVRSSEKRMDTNPHLTPVLHSLKPSGSESNPSPCNGSPGVAKPRTTLTPKASKAKLLLQAVVKKGASSPCASPIRTGTRFLWTTMVSSVSIMQRAESRPAEQTPEEMLKWAKRIEELYTEARLEGSRQQGDYSVFDELVSNLVSAPTNARWERRSALSHFASEGIKRTGLPGMQIGVLLLVLYTMEGQDIDRLLGFTDVPPVDADGDERDEYEKRFQKLRQRNPVVSAGVPGWGIGAVYKVTNWAMRSAFSAPGSSTAHSERVMAEAELRRWIQFIAGLFALPSEISTSAMMVSLENVKQEAGKTVAVEESFRRLRVRLNTASDQVLWRGVSGLSDADFGALSKFECGMHIGWSTAASTTLSEFVARRFSKIRDRIPFEEAEVPSDLFLEMVPEHLSQQSSPARLQGRAVGPKDGGIEVEWLGEGRRTVESR